ncbi:hypothetical protein ILUMI_19135 [Ignelater luminosus]|uniref:Major facilitator superfamily associated domain-containing protein n=1 Tax=Ignelater luminosus TaxID=2038154 RepID=A0A8K0G662_IGNLU|nr:hypothetical protein ILUMI_19135 [Ignelater luminosus]
MKHAVPIGECVYFKVNKITFENGNSTYPNCLPEHQVTALCDIKCDSYIINDLVAHSTKFDEEDVYLKYQFWLLLIIFLIAWVGQAITVSIGDTICFQLLGDKPHKYGYQRMYGALGWGLFSIMSGFLVDYFSEGESKKNYAPVFSIGVGILLLCVIVSYKIQYTQQRMSASILRDIGRLLANIKIFVFVLWCISIGLCTALMWNFLFWLLEELAANHGCEMQSWIKTIEGLVMGIQCLGGELPFFFLSSWILKRIGHVNAMSLVLLVIGVRFIFYSVITNPWYTLPIEFCNGLTFGLFYATMASYASIVAPPGTEATTQGLVGAVFEGIGVSLGSFIGGLFFQEFGGSMTFRIFGISALVVCLLHAGVQYLIQRREDQGKGGLKPPC